MMIKLSCVVSLNYPAMQSVGAIAILFCLAFIICSFMLVQGVRKEYRGLFFPWMICMTLVVLFQAVYGLWIIIGYYIVSFLKIWFNQINLLIRLLFNRQLWNVFVSIVNWIWMAANVSFMICYQTVWRWNLIPFFSRCISFCAFGASTKSWQSCKPDTLSCSTRKKCKRRVPSSLSLFYHQKVDPFWCVAAHRSIEAKKLISAVNLDS